MIRFGVQHMLRRMALGSLVLGSLLAFSAAISWAAGPSDEYLKLVVKLIGDNDREFRAAALDQVRSGAGGVETTKVLAALLPKLDGTGQAALIGALAER